MKCSKCGNELKKDDLFCTKCGKKVEQEIREDKTEKSLNSNEKEKQKSKKWKIIVPILIILIIIIAVGTFIFKKNVDNLNEENLQEVSNVINTDQTINEDILTVVSKEKVNTERGFINLCKEYGEYIEIPSSLYKENHNCFVVSIRVDASKIDEVYEELSNNEQVLKVEKGFINPKEIELYTGYEMLVYQLLNDEEERNGFGIYYAMVDINNDGTNELALIHGKSRADAITEFYTYQNNSETVKIGEGAQGEIYKVKNENKLKLVYIGTGGSQTIWDISYDNNNFEINENTSDTNLENIGEKIELDNAEETYGYYIGLDNSQNNEISSMNNSNLDNSQSRTVTNTQTETKYTDKELSKQIIDSIFVTVTGRYEGAPQYTLYRRGEYYEPATNEEYSKLGNRDDYHIYPENAYKTGNIFFTIYFDTWVNAEQFNEYQENKKDYDMDQTTAMGYKVTVTNNTTGESKNIKMTDISGNSSDTFEQAGTSYTLVISDKFGNSKTLNFNK